MIDQGILKGAPKGATHFSWDGYYLKYDINRVLEIYHVNYKHWQQASTWIGVDRSLDDIKRIAELEKVLALVKKDLLMRAEEDSNGCKVVDLSSSIWIKLTEALKEDK